MLRLVVRTGNNNCSGPAVGLPENTILPSLVLAQETLRSVTLAARSF